MKILEKKQDAESQWLPISDLMAVLMMVFLLIAISYMLNESQKKKKIEEVAITYNNLQNKLYEDLNSEFQEDLKRWGAEIDKQTLSVKFKSPKTLFPKGSAKMKQKFKSDLAEFFPRFIQILYRDEYKNDIEEIRIEGHTSSEGKSGNTESEAYIYNMQLSQNRTRNVLEYVLKLQSNTAFLQWIRSNLTANGLSSSKLELNDDGTENRNLSRRVEFRVKTNAEKRIAKILAD